MIWFCCILKVIFLELLHKSRKKILAHRKNQKLLISFSDLLSFYVKNEKKNPQNRSFKTGYNLYHVANVQNI